MNTEDTGSVPDAADVTAWLDGLAGRPGVGPEHAEGQRLRDALLPASQVSGLLPWHEIERRAVQAVPPEPAPLRAEATAGQPLKLAANASRWRPAYGLAAVLVLGVALVWTQREPEPGPALRGAADDAPAGAVWIVDQPAEAAERLAKDLQALGAQVEASTRGGEVLLRVQVPEAARPAVNQRLAQQELALDVLGRLNLRVRAP
jgi:hypothetical protein